MICITVTYLIAECDNLISLIHCTPLKVIAEIIRDLLQMFLLTKLVKCILELIIAHSKHRCCISLWKSEFHMIACIMKTTGSIYIVGFSILCICYIFIISMAVSTPGKCTGVFQITTHICVIEIQTFLQCLCIVEFYIQIFIRCGITG